MNAEEFILIPKKLYLKDRPLTEQVLQNPSIQEKGMQLSMLQRFQPTKQHVVQELSSTKQIREIVFDQLQTLNDQQLKKSEYIFSSIEKNGPVSIDNGGNILIDDSNTGLSASTFLYNLQQTNKVIDTTLYTTLIKHLRIPEHFVANTHAKKIIKGKESIGWTSLKS